MKPPKVQPTTFAVTPNLERAYLSPEKMPSRDPEWELAEAEAALNTAFNDLQRANQAAAAAQLAAEELSKKLALSEARKSHLRAWIVVIASVVFVAAISWGAYFFSRQWAKSDGPDTANTIPSAPSQSLPASKKFNALTTPQVGQAVNRLHDAFSAFPGESQSDVIGRVNQKHPGACALSSDNGGTSLNMNYGKGLVQPSIVKAMNQCAATLEQLSQDESRVVNVKAAR